MTKGNLSSYTWERKYLEKLSHLLEDAMLRAAGLFLPVTGFRIQRNALRLELSLADRCCTPCLVVPHRG
eukprot:186468-Prorocentrum_minimum.AAC.1